MTLNKATLSNRVKKAKSAKVEMLDSRNFIVKGSRGDRYDVLIRDDEKPARAICYNLTTGRYCQGNRKSVCYHVIAALLARATAADGDIKVAFCANSDDARRLGRIGGTPHRTRNGLQSAELWFVSFADKSDAQVDDFQTRYFETRIGALNDAIAAIDQQVADNTWANKPATELKKYQAARDALLADHDRGAQKLFKS